MNNYNLSSGCASAVVLMLGSFITVTTFACFLACIIGLPVMWLWNWLMPVIFGLPEISFLQAVGMMLLSHFLIKGSVNINNEKTSKNV